MKKGNIIVTVLAFFTIFFVFCSFAIDFSMVLAARSRLQTATETAVLIAADKISVNTAETTARKAFSFFRANDLKYARITNLTIKAPQKAIYIKTAVPAQTYFLSALGINSVEIQAQAAARIMPLKLEQDINFNLENHLQYTSPILITAKTGTEIEIKRAETSGEYRVFAGLNDKISETKWVEITCSSSDTNEQKQTFDLNADCITENNNGGISAVKYLRIINKSQKPLDIESVTLTNTAKLIPLTEFSEL